MLLKVLHFHFENSKESNEAAFSVFYSRFDLGSGFLNLSQVKIILSIIIWQFHRITRVGSHSAVKSHSTLLLHFTSFNRPKWPNNGSLENVCGMNRFVPSVSSTNHNLNGWSFNSNFYRVVFEAKTGLQRAVPENSVWSRSGLLKGVTIKGGEERGAGHAHFLHDKMLVLHIRAQ